jgi:hypothetical protein
VVKLLLKFRSCFSAQHFYLKRVLIRQNVVVVVVFTFVNRVPCEECEPGHDVEVSNVVAEVAEQLVAAQPPRKLAAAV